MLLKIVRYYLAITMFNNIILLNNIRKHHRGPENLDKGYLRF